MHPTAAVAGIGASGVLSRWDSRPPPLVVLLIVLLAATVTLALSPIGKKFGAFGPDRLMTWVTWFRSSSCQASSSPPPSSATSFSGGDCSAGRDAVGVVPVRAR